ncbi:hypothetical protein RVS70_05625 [Virgibacillus sp. M23]|uniref:hypothetical protein n=1 Tax=Virgibacillus sp. M23 TaxID=3079030 RepID=UPI002A91EB6A|nr:hypothetical protein [Virgibacillus sp. M23]MDY7043680.1 hypothetical protein [Virgibacillus sp. M23]
MKNKKINGNSFNFPVQFEQLENLLDNRFMRVKIWVAHTGENRNNCYFTKELLESMIPTLVNIPITGLISKQENLDIDFNAHEERLVVEDNEIKLKYFGHAYGMIPENNNAKFEYRYGEDGVEREYLTVEGLLWNKFDDVEKIFDRDGGFKSHSMELEPTSVEGYTNDEGLFVFTKAKFEALCILGEGVTPAMISSTIERFSVSSTIKKEFSEMLKEFNRHFSTAEKGDNDVPDNENVLENNDNQAPENEETKQESLQKPNFTSEDEDNHITDEPQPQVNEGQDDNPEKFTRTFELSHDDIRWSLYMALDEHEEFKDKWYYIAQVFDSYAIVEDEDGNKFYKVNYVKHEENVSIGEYEEIFPMWVNQSEKSAIEMARNNFSALEEEVKELREFKSKFEVSEKESELAQYSSHLSEDEYKNLKENINNFSMNDLKKELGLLLLNKNHFSAKNEEESSRVSATNINESNPYGDLATYFHK